jgi:IS5 family transposase
LNFRRLLKTHGLAEQIFKQANAHLQRKGLSLRSGTIVDATIIYAPSATKDADGDRDPEMHQAKRGKEDVAFGDSAAPASSSGRKADRSRRSSSLAEIGTTGPCRHSCFTLS